METESVFCQDSGDVIHCQAAVYLVIYHHNRRQSAGAYTAAGVQRELAVGSTFAVGNAQKLFELFENVAGALNVAGGSETDGNPVLALGLKRELRIEGADPVNLLQRDSGFG